MKFMVLVKGSENAGAPPAELMAGIAKLGEDAAKAGVMVETGGLFPSAMGARVRIANGGKISVTDGPFTEVREVIGGYAVYRVNSKQEAIEWTKRFMELHRVWKGWEGEAEIRQIFEESDG
jgi:hypothetical protein